MKENRTHNSERTKTLTIFYIRKYYFARVKLQMIQKMLKRPSQVL